MKHINLRLFSSFFKIGAFTFGGGWAMISLLEEDIVNKHKWLEKEEFIDNLAIAQSLPGIMAVNVAIAVGYKLNKIWGSIFAVLGTILPSFMIILAIAMFLTPDTIKNNETLTRIFKGIRPAVVALMLSPVCTPTGSMFSMLQTVMQLPALSRMTSYSISFHPAMQRSTRTCPTRDRRRPFSRISTSSS